ncbi:DNA mismatch repair endonuclease MutL [bacterium]|nr:DNA mismatch repair endonuclease MutL [bacterium]
MSARITSANDQSVAVENETPTTSPDHGGVVSFDPGAYRKVRLLTENVANMIAAGEVVERPASVVKELVENALDAGATRVMVDVQIGGRRSIRVADDGHGMDEDDALLALERHATSKISDERDLFAVRSFGFRGEALAAVASVSRFTMRTARAGAQAGTRIVVEGGRVREVVKEGGPPGTDIEVRDLFFNTPARRKFLRSPETELTHIVDAVTRVALVHEGVFFRLRADGKTLLQVPQAADLAQRASILLGPDAAAGLVRLTAERPRVRLEGYLSGPQTTRSTPGYYFVYCNGRYLRDRLITHAISTGYRGHILKGRYPVVLLKLDVPSELVDVNVHPTKTEVRFRDGSSVFEAIVSAIDATLRDRFGAAENPFEPAIRSAPRPASFGGGGESTAWPERESGEPGPAFTAPLFHEAPPPETDEAEVAKRPDADPGAPMFREGHDEEPEAGPFSRLAIVGQMFRNYIVCESAESGGMMVMIDAHAAHEKILFEKLRVQYETNRIPVQAQLVPIRLDLRRAESDALKKCAGALLAVGIEVEEFGGDTWRIVAIPSILSGGEAEGAVRECVERWLETGQGGSPAPADRFLSVVACHSAVRSGQELTVAQMREILRGLDRTRGAASCPHGRPTFWYVPLMEIEKRFKRR